MYAIRKVLAPATVAPQRGTNSEGPKSGDHSGLVSYVCVYVHVLGHKGHLHLKVHLPLGIMRNHPYGSVLPSSSGDYSNKCHT